MYVAIVRFFFKGRPLLLPKVQCQIMSNTCMVCNSVPHPKTAASIFRKPPTISTVPQIFFLTLYSKSFWWVAAFARLVVSTFPPLSKLIWCPLTFLYKSISRCSKLKLCVCQLFVDVHFPSLGKIIPFFLGPDLLRIFKIAL